MTGDIAHGDDRAGPNLEDGVLVKFFNDGAMEIVDQTEDDAWIKASDDSYFEIDDGWSR